MSKLHIEEHAAGHYVISGYHPEARRNKEGQLLVTHDVCQIVFAEEGRNNGVTPEILLELIERHTGGAPAAAAPVKQPANPAIAERMAKARAARGRKPELANA